MSIVDLAQYIDHTLLRPDASEEEIRKLCAEAREYGFFTVCVEKRWVSLAASLLKGSPVKTITVVGFPSGDESTAQKVAETKAAVADGAQEIDMVLNRTLLKAKRYEDVLADIRQVVLACQPLPVKVIFETSELDQEQKVLACALAKTAGATFVKTSTGFSKSGATEADVRLMRSVVGEGFGVKASGGIRDTETARKMVAAGATRLGTSASVAIVQGKKPSAGAY